MAGNEADLDLSQLTYSQQEALQQFTSVTDQDLGKALPLLKRCEWNVQIAISRFFDGEPAEQPEDSTPPTPPPQTSRRSDTLAQDFTTPLRAPPVGRRFDPAHRVTSQSEDRMTRPSPFILSLFLTPANILYNLLSRVFNIFSYLFPFLPRLLNRLTTRGSGSVSSRNAGGRRPLGPQDTTLRFLREFEEEYGPHQLPFLATGYGKAFDLAKQNLKFLVVIPLSPEHDETNYFVRNVLLSESVSNFLVSNTSTSTTNNNDQRNVLIWAGNTQDSEAYQVSQSLQITKFPCTVVVAHTPSVSSTAMSVLTRIYSPRSPEEYIERLQAAIMQHSDTLNRVRRERADQQAARNLREQQNSAYERSLAQDRERMRAKKKAEEEKAREEKERADKEEKRRKYAEDLERWRRWRASSLSQEPSIEEDVVRLSVKLSDGERITRRFKAQAKIEEVYAVVECWDALKESLEMGTIQEKEPIGFQHSYGFRLVSPMPREVYDVNSEGTVAEKIGKSGNLMVERIEDDEEEEEEEE